MNPKRYNLPIEKILSLGVSISLFITILSEYYLGRTMAIALSSGITGLLFFLFFFYEKKISLPYLPTIFFLIYLVWNIGITPFSQDITQSLWEDVRLIGLFLLFILAFNVTKEKESLTKIVSLFLICGSFLLIFDVATYLLFGEFTNQSYLVGHFSWHNQMAGFLLLFIPVLLIALTGTLKHRLFFIMMVIVAVSALLFSYSRGGWIIMFLQIAFLVGFLKKINRKVVYGSLIGLLTLGGITLTIQPTLLSNAITSLPQEFTSEKTVSGNFRINTWLTGIDIVNLFPVTGVGPGAFGSVFATFQDVPWLYARNAHNHILQIASESGIFGVTAFVILLVSLFSSIVKTLLEKKKGNALLFGLFIACIGLFLHSLIDYDFSTVSLYLLFFVFLGISIGLTKSKEMVIKLNGINKLFLIFVVIYLFTIIIIQVSEDSYLSARYYLSEGRYQFAKESVHKSLSLNPLHGKAYILSSELYYLTKDFSSSERDAQMASSYLPYENKHLSILGAIAAEQQNFSLARDYYKSAIDIKPFSDPNLYVGLAYSYEMLGDVKKADEVLSHAIVNIFPLNKTYSDFEYLYFASGLTNDLAGLYVYTAKIKMELGKQEEATDLLKTVKEKLTIPDDAIKLNRNDMLE